MMKFFLAITLIAAVASAAVRPTPVSAEVAEIQEIIAAIQSPSTDPVTAAALEQMLLDALGIKPEPVAVGPAIVNPVEGIAVGPAIVNPVEGIAVGPAIVNPVEGIAVGPAIVPFPLPDGGAVSESVVAPSPVAIIEGPAPAASVSTPLVQIILNINQAAGSSPVAVSPVDVIAPEITPDPIHIVDVAPEPVQVVEVAPEPVHVVEVAPELPPINPIAVNPVGVVDVEPVQIGVPVIPEAAVVLPEELN